MDTPAVAAVGDRCHILLGRDWHPGVVAAVGRWSHCGGNTYPVYTVRFPDGSTVRCGNNSLRSSDKP